MTVGERDRAGASPGTRPARGAPRVAPAWIAPIVAFVVVVALGTIGFTRHQAAAGSVDPLTTRIYLAIQLFVLEGGAVPGPVPWELDVARHAAPAVAAWAIVLAVASLFREELDRLRVRAMRGHTVVVGLGRRSRRIVETLLERGVRVVAIESDPAHPSLADMRARGVPVVVGDARLAATLGPAGIGRAARLVVLTGDDAANLEAAAAARDAAALAGRTEPLEVIVHLADPDLALLLWAAEAEGYGDTPVRFDFVNVDAAGARAILAAWPPAPGPAGSTPHVAVVGTGPLACEVLLALARTAPSGGGDGRVDVTVAASDGVALDTLLERHPEVARRLRIRRVERARDVWSGGVPDPVLVCPGDDRAAARAALEVRSIALDRPTRVVVAVEERAGLGTLLEGAGRLNRGTAVEVFPLLEAACDPDTLLAGPTELLARALHAAYVEDTPAAADDPAHRDWDDLPEALRASNRDQAAHVAVKLAAVGRAVGPLASWDEATAPFPDDEVETMARLEHERWTAERRRAGWRTGPRDASRRTTPYLVPWEELTEDVRELDRLFVRRLPALLAGVGLQAHRVGPGPVPSTPPDPSISHADPASASVGRLP